MDQEFIEKMNSISAWHETEDNAEQAEFQLEFSTLEDGLITLSSSKGKITHKLKPLSELYSFEKSDTPEKDRQLDLLYAIEGPIKRYYMDHPELTDAIVILALEKLAVKPEITDGDALVTRISNELRLKLSASNYSRDEVRRAIRKILESAKRHNEREGRRGYLEFIVEYVP
ncbi:MAG: hypothetical protein ONB44_18095 [candidate division KSB1 bacterium]|nr:hypothetical protein [candidate division KSB1 bacterium]MDZ7304040.1 hypothetical protein [candidate division KSB1 bacterium]MDZ7313249.1 hypothetical protein [candidate division KSB1 bacterium]